MERLFNIINYLKNNDNLTASRLAHLCSTTERTIYRDVRKLDNLGIQVISMGKKGYHLVDAGKANIPAKLTQEEYLALHLFHSMACQNKDEKSILYSSYSVDFQIKQG